MSNAPSLLRSHTEREEAVRKANETWDTFCIQMSESIPTNLCRFAREKGWIKHPNWWKLPEWLGFLVENTRNGGCNEMKFSQRQLASYGFNSFDDVVTKMGDLERAWNGLITIWFSRREEPDRITIYFKANEVISRPLGERFTISVLEPGVTMVSPKSADQPLVEPGTYEVERIANPYGTDYDPWLIIVGTTTGMCEQMMHKKEQIIFAA